VRVLVVVPYDLIPRIIQIGNQGPSQSACRI